MLYEKYCILAFQQQVRKYLLDQKSRFPDQFEANVQCWSWIREINLGLKREISVSKYYVLMIFLYLYHILMHIILNSVLFLALDIFIKANPCIAKIKYISFKYKRYFIRSNMFKFSVQKNPHEGGGYNPHITQIVTPMYTLHKFSLYVYIENMYIVMYFYLNNYY